MNDRDSSILTIRGGTIGDVQPQSSKDEIFQNQTLRPILKFQNELFLESFVNYIHKHKDDFYSLSTEKKMVFIENAMKGMIMALFTVEEFREYALNSSSLNKRMMNLLIERLKDQIQLLTDNK
jgi:hypothetical protein